VCGIITNVKRPATLQAFQFGIENFFNLPYGYLITNLKFNVVLVKLIEIQVFMPFVFAKQKT